MENIQISNNALGKKILSTTDVKNIVGVSYKQAQKIIQEIRILNSSFYKKSPIRKNQVASIHLTRYIGWEDDVYLAFQNKLLF